MADDLADILQRFELSREETTGIELQGTDVKQSVEECTLSLVGKILGEKIANFTGLKNYVNHAWGFPRHLRISEVGPNLYHFIFSLDEEMQRVLNGGPWILDNQLLVVRKWKEGIERDKEAFRSTFLWVQIWNLPIHWVSQATGFKLGKLFKDVKEVVIPQGGSKGGKYLKILVNVDLCKPLIRGTIVKLGGSSCWVDFKYEKCPDFCYKCGRIGHVETYCQSSSEQRQTKHGNQFGPWLKAGGAKQTAVRKVANPAGTSPSQIHLPISQNNRGLEDDGDSSLRSNSKENPIVQGSGLALHSSLQNQIQSDTFTRHDENQIPIFSSDVTQRIVGERQNENCLPIACQPGKDAGERSQPELQGQTNFPFNLTQIKAQQPDAISTQIIPQPSLPKHHQYPSPITQLSNHSTPLSHYEIKPTDHSPSKSNISKTFTPHHNLVNTPLTIQATSLCNIPNPTSLMNPNQLPIHIALDNGEKEAMALDIKVTNSRKWHRRRRPPLEDQTNQELPNARPVMKKHKLVDEDENMEDSLVSFVQSRKSQKVNTASSFKSGEGEVSPNGPPALQ